MWPQGSADLGCFIGGYPTVEIPNKIQKGFLDAKKKSCVNAVADSSPNFYFRFFPYIITKRLQLKKKRMFVAKKVSPIHFPDES
jgi:hypothetical protein